MEATKEKTGRMIKLLIVDDEPIIRIGLKALFSGAPGEELALFEAPNGVAAKELLQEMPVDIVMTDIKMPQMDGLELTAWIRKNLPGVVVIILSNYFDYEYVRRAMKLGVSEYLSKYAVNQDTPKRVIDVYRRQKEGPSPNTKWEMHELVLKELAAGHDMQHVRTKDGDDNWSQDSKVFACLRLKHYDHVVATRYGGDRHALDTQLKGLLVVRLKKDFDAQLFIETRGKYYVILNKSGGEDVAEKLKSVQRSVREEMGLKIDIGYSADFSRIGDVNNARREAENGLERCFFLRGSCNVVPGKAADAPRFPDDAFIRRAVDESRRLFAGNDFAAFTRYARAMATELAEKGNSAEAVKRLAAEVADAFKLSRAKYVDAAGAEAFCADVQSRIRQAENLHDIDKAFGEIENRRACYLKSMIRPGKYDDITNRALEYLNARYCDSTLCLIGVAGAISVNPTYLSRNFKEKTGKGFITYLTELRVEHAAELLRHRDKLIKEVCFEVGYENYNHFCKIIKKYTGKSPGELRGE
jgi:two-component system response regulator YesN